MMYSLKVLLEADIDLEDKNVSSGLENDEPLTEPQILKIKKLIATKLNSLSDSNLDKELGKLSLNNLKSLSRIPVLGKYYIDPAQTNSGQGKGTTAYDVSKYKSMQIVPFFVYGKDGENYNAENSRESYNLIFLVPAIGVDISEDNMEKHKKYFDKQKGFKIQDRYDKLLPTQVADIRVTNEELGKVTASFKTGNPSTVPAINSKKASRRSSPQTESLGIGRNKENIVDNYNIIKTYNNNSHRKNSSMNDIFSGKLSNYLFEDNQGEKPNVSVTGKTDALQDLKLANKFAGSFNTTEKSITSIISTFEQKGLVPAVNVKKIVSSKNSLQIIPFIKKDEQDILAVEKNKVQQVVLEIIPIPNIKINEKNKEFFQAFFGIEGELPAEGSTYKFSDIDTFKTVFLPIKKDLETSIKELETAILLGKSEILLKLNKISKQGTISTNPTIQQQNQQKEQEVQSESFIHTQGNLSSLLIEWRDEDSLKYQIKTNLIGGPRMWNARNAFENLKKRDFSKERDLKKKKEIYLRALREILDETTIESGPIVYLNFFSKEGRGIELKNKRIEALIEEFNALVGPSETTKVTKSEVGETTVVDANEEEDRADPEPKSETGAEGDSDGESEPASEEASDSSSGGEQPNQQNIEKTLNSLNQQLTNITPDTWIRVKDKDESRYLIVFASNVHLFYTFSIENEKVLGTYQEYENFDDVKAMITNSNKLDISTLSFDVFDRDYEDQEEVNKYHDQILDLVDKLDNRDQPKREKSESEVETASEESDDLPEEVREFIGDADAEKDDHFESGEVFIVNNNVFQKKLEEIQKNVEINSANIDNNNTRLFIKYNVDSKRIQLSLTTDENIASYLSIPNGPDGENKSYHIHADDIDRTVIIQKTIENSKKKEEFLKWFGSHLAVVFGENSPESKAFKEKVEELRPEPAETAQEEDSAESTEGSETETESAPEETDNLPKSKPAAHKPNIEGIFKAKILDLYNKKISIDNSDEIIKVLKSKGDDKLTTILDVISGKTQTESFVYKSLGLDLLLESEDGDDNTSKKLEKIDINVIFSNIQKTLYDNSVLNKQVKDIEDLITKNTTSSNMNEIFKAASKFLGMTRARFDDIYRSSRSGPDYKLDLSKTIAYGICESILEDKESFAEKGFEIVGSLKKLDDIRLGGGNILYSDRTYSRLAQEMKKAGGDGAKFEELSREELNERLDESVKKVILDIAIAQHMRYDEDLKAVVKPKLEKWRKSDEMSQKDHDKIKGGIGDGKHNRAIAGATVGVLGAVIGGIFGGPAGALIGSTLGGASGSLLSKGSDEEKFTSRKDIWANETEVKQSADKLFEVVTSLAADIKDIYLESKTSYIRGSLTGLLFENLLSEADAKELTYEDIRKTLKSNDILAFGFPDVENRKEAEVSLVESVGGMLEDTFDIKIKGIKNGAAALAMERLTSSVDKDAEKGKAAVEEISEMTAGSGVPPTMKDAMTPEQFMKMMNMSGGPMMMMFMQMMMQQQFQQQMAQMFEQMQKGKVSGTEAAETVENASGGKLSTVENALEEALKSYNATKPALNVEDARKIILTLKENKGIINKEIKDLIQKINKSKSDEDKIEEFSLKSINAKSILKDLKNHVKIVKDEKTDDKVFDLLNVNIFSENNDYTTPLTTTLIILVIKNGDFKEINKKIDSLKLFVENAARVKLLVSNLSKSIKIRVEESYSKNDLFVGRLTERLFESDNSRNKVLCKNKPIKNASYNSEYLQTEMKRIWKI